MSNFRVITIVDGDTFDVSPRWQWNGQTGSRIRPAGYDAPELTGLRGYIAKTRLEKLILGHDVELRSAHTMDRGRLVCEVYYGGKNLADYFPEYQ
ncbi:MAG: thermonuclease family protein [bacterium]